MTHPDWYPADVWEAALKVWQEIGGQWHADVEIIARAILAERERCASIAEVAGARAKLYGAEAVHRVCEGVHRSIENGWEAS